MAGSIESLHVLPTFQNTTSPAYVHSHGGSARMVHLSKAFYRVGTEHRCGDHGKRNALIVHYGQQVQYKTKNDFVKAAPKQAQEAHKHTNSDT